MDKLRVTRRPGHCPRLGFKEPINHHRILFPAISTAFSGCFSANDCGARIHGGAGDIIENDLTPEWNFLGIDRAVSLVQSSSGPAGALARAFSGPIDGDASQQGFMRRAGELNQTKTDTGKNK